MSFVTDLLWRSPLGLRINAQATADVLMTEDWVKIRGDQLAPRDGAYDLRVTAELWETHFFDLVSLLAVDHPAGTEVFVDERFAVPPPTLAGRPDRPGAAVRVGARRRGGDVSTLAAARDSRYHRFRRPRRLSGDHARRTSSKSSCRTRRRGAGRCGSSRRAGSIRPTARSTSRSRRARRRAPQSLSLHVADGDGRFREVRRGLGFPAGKDKTILHGSDRRCSRRAGRGGSGWRRTWRSTGIGWDGRSAGRTCRRWRRGSSSRPRISCYRGYSVTEQPNPACPSARATRSAGTAPRVARSRGLLHAVRRRAGAARQRRRPLRHHECRRRAAAALSRSAGRRRPASCAISS